MAEGSSASRTTGAPQARRFETHEVFNQSPPFGDINLFTSDRVLQETVTRECGGAELDRLAAFGELTGSARALELGRQANEFVPILRRFDENGVRLDQVEYHPVYHELMAISMRQGLHCAPFAHLGDGTEPAEGVNVVRCAGSYMAAQMESGHCCPITMTNAAIPVFLNQPDIAETWLPKILSRDYDPAFRPVSEKKSATIGMGMTEKQGGTDVRANTTRAMAAGSGGPGKEYILTGHKWFMSAPMCDAFFVLAQAKGGLSCFLLPRFLPDGSKNNIHFQRLKNKLGNRSNASSEVEFHDAHGWLIGGEGRGVRTIIDMVTYTRLDCAVSTAGLMRFCLANAIHHAGHRTVFQKKLIDQPLMARVLADMALDVEAATALAFRLARAFDHPDDEAEAAFRRLMTPVIKYWVCKVGPAVSYEAMECLGGNGYVEDGLLARVYREIPVNAIWEGSGNVMCLDVLRVMAKSPGTLDTVIEEFSMAAGKDARLAIGINLLKELIAKPAELEANARQMVELLALICAGGLLLNHAPPAISDAFLKSRLIGRWFHTYGAGLQNADIPAILDRAALRME